MTMEVIESISDFTGDTLEDIRDVAIDIGEFSKNAVENINPQEMEALQKGDIQKAIQYSDMPEEDKDIVSNAIEQVGFSKKGQVVSTLQITAGALQTIAALATPGFQVWGVVAAASMFKGMKDLISQSDSKNANELANA